MFLELGLAAFVAPSFYYSFKNIEDEKLFRTFTENDVPIIKFDLGSKVVFDEKKEKNKVVQFYSSSRLNFVKTSYSFLGAISFAPFMRHATLLIGKEDRSINVLTKHLNCKLKCEHCGIVCAFWQYHSITEVDAKCSFCKKRTSYFVSDAIDDETPYFHRKNTKEVYRFFKYIKKYKPSFNNPKAEAQINSMNKLNEENGFIDDSKGPKMLELDEVFKLSEMFN